MLCPCPREPHRPRRLLPDRSCCLPDRLRSHPSADRSTYPLRNFGPSPQLNRGAHPESGWLDIREGSCRSPLSVHSRCSAWHGPWTPWDTFRPVSGTVGSTHRTCRRTTTRRIDPGCRTATWDPVPAPLCAPIQIPLTSPELTNTGHSKGGPAQGSGLMLVRGEVLFRNVATPS